MEWKEMDEEEEEGQAGLVVGPGPAGPNPLWLDPPLDLPPPLC